MAYTMEEFAALTPEQIDEINKEEIALKRAQIERAQALRKLMDELIEKYPPGMPGVRR